MTIKLYKESPQTKDSARVRAALLADYLGEKIGGKWKVRVWKHVIWNYSAYLGSIQVTYFPNTQTFGTGIWDVKGVACAGYGAWASNNSSSRPDFSVKKAMAEMEHKVLTYVDVMNDNRKKMGMPIYKIHGIHQPVVHRSSSGTGTSSGSSKRPGQRR